MTWSFRTAVTRRRIYGGQRFLRHVAADTPWTPANGGEAQETALEVATSGLAEARTLGRSTAILLRSALTEGSWCSASSSMARRRSNPRHARGRAGRRIRHPARSRMEAATEPRPTSAFFTSPPQVWTSLSNDCHSLYSTGRNEGDQLATARISRESPCFCPATTRKRRSRPRSPASGRRCPAPPSTSTTTIAATAP